VRKSGLAGKRQMLPAENFDGKNVDELVKICQYFPHQIFVPYGIWTTHLGHGM